MNISDKIQFEVLLFKRNEIKYLKMMYFLINGDQYVVLSFVGNIMLMLAAVNAQCQKIQ